MVNGHPGRPGPNVLPLVVEIFLRLNHGHVTTHLQNMEGKNALTWSQKCGQKYVSFLIVPLMVTGGSGVIFVSAQNPVREVVSSESGHAITPPHYLEEHTVQPLIMVLWIVSLVM